MICYFCPLSLRFAVGTNTFHSSPTDTSPFWHHGWNFFLMCNSALYKSRLSDHANPTELQKVPQDSSALCHLLPSLYTAIATSQRTDCHPYLDLIWHFHLSLWGEGIEIHTLIPLIFPSQSSEMHGDFFDSLKTSSLNSLIREKHTDSIK